MNALSLRRAPQPATDDEGILGLPPWARIAYGDLRGSSRTVGAESLLGEESVTAYLTLSGPEEGYWPARAYWRDMATYMGESRRKRLAMARLWPEFLRFRQGRRSPSCTDVRRLLLAGGQPRGNDCRHAARCEHCRMFTIYADEQLPLASSR